MLWVEMLQHTLQVCSRISVSERRWAVISSGRLREDTCSRDLSITGDDPIIRRHCTRWGMCFVVVRYYDGICHSLGDKIVLIIFDSEYDSEKESVILCNNGNGVFTN